MRGGGGAWRGRLAWGGNRVDAADDTRGPAERQPPFCRSGPWTLLALRPVPVLAEASAAPPSTAAAVSRKARVPEMRESRRA